MNDLDLCIHVMSTSALHSTLNISENVRDRGLVPNFQRTTNKKWNMGYQMVTLPMTSRNPKGAGGSKVGYPSDSLASYSSWGDARAYFSAILYQSHRSRTKDSPQNLQYCSEAFLQFLPRIYRRRICRIVLAKNFGP